MSRNSKRFTKGQYKSKASENDNSLFLKVAISLGVLVLLGVIAAVVNTYRNQQSQQNHQEQLARKQSIKKKKEQPKFKSYDSENDDNGSDTSANELTKNELLKHIKDDIEYGFNVISDKGALSTYQLKKKDFSSKEYQEFEKHFDSVSVFNDFNAAVNVSTASGENVYGQNGSYKIHKTSKQGDAYSLTDGKIENTGSNYEDNIYDVIITYKAGKISNRTVLSLQVNKETGIIDSVKAKGNQNND